MVIDEKIPETPSNDTKDNFGDEINKNFINFPKNGWDSKILAQSVLAVLHLHHVVRYCE